MCPQVEDRAASPPGEEGEEPFKLPAERSPWYPKEVWEPIWRVLSAKVRWETVPTVVLERYIERMRPKLSLPEQQLLDSLQGEVTSEHPAP